MSFRTQGLCGLIDQEIRAHTLKSGNAGDEFRNFIQFIRASSRLLDPNQFHHAGSHDALTRLIRGLLRMSLNRAHFVRPVESWFCDDNSRFDQVDSLIQHLFAKYPLPRFLNHVWFEDASCCLDRTSKSTPGVSFYLALGRGESTRRSGLPIRLSRAETHQFMQAPDDLNIWEAIRWAQVRSLGGSSRLVRAILETRLGERQEDEIFWHEVIAFFCRAEQSEETTLTEQEVVSTVTFCREQRFEPASRVLGYRFVDDDRPLQPNFSLKNRSLRWLRRHQVNWRREIELPELTTAAANDKRGTWSSTGLASFHDEVADEVWMVKELLSAHELEVEGGILKHCVAAYDRYCLRSVTSIWSMRVLRNDVWKRVLTIEVCPHLKQVVQVKGKANSEPAGTAANVLRLWAKLANLNWS